MKRDGLAVNVLIPSIFITGCFEILKIAFTAKRRSGYYFIKVYFPAILCTVVSWLAFWIDPRSIGDRGTVGITSLLTQMFLVQSVNENMPRVSYVKAADLFLIVSFAFSFTTLLESVIVYKAASTEKRKVKSSPITTQEHETDQQTCVSNQNEETAVNVLERKNRISMILHLTEAKGISEVQETNRLMETWIDRIFRILFPSAYAAFLVGYFTTYMA